MSVQPLTTQADRGPAIAAAASDAELLEAVADGSDAAFEELRHRYQGAVERTCRSILRGGVEDCAQEAFVRIWQKARLFDSRRGSAAAAAAGRRGKAETAVADSDDSRRRAPAAPDRPDR